MLEGGLRRFPFADCSGYVFPKANQPCNFPYGEVFNLWMGGVDFQWYGIES